MKYEININEFQGPKQYLDYIQKMEELNLDIASEYLVMAAELIEIKSSSLLPKSDIEDDEFEEDPKEKLINRLLEYEQYKNMTSTFKELEEYRGEIYTREPDNLLDYKNDDYKINLKATNAS